MSPDETYVRVDDDAIGGLWLWCPGCDDAHRVTLTGSTVWTWNGDRERPTLSPSLLVHKPFKYNGAGNPTSNHVCHSFVRDGQWEFLTDSTHTLAGQTVPIVPLPEWLREENR